MFGGFLSSVHTQVVHFFNDWRSILQIFNHMGIFCLIFHTDDVITRKIAMTSFLYHASQETFQSAIANQRLIGENQQKTYLR